MNPNNDLSAIGTLEFNPRSGSNPADFAPALLRIQEKPPAPLAGWVLVLLLGLCAGVLLWSVLGQLDIVAVAEGKLVPQSYLKIVQATEQSVVREILVREGEAVAEGQVLIRMDPIAADADVRTLANEFANRRLAMRRIDAQLAGSEFGRESGDPAAVHASVAAQYAANVQAYQNALAQERASLEKAEHDLAAAKQTRAKLEQVLPHFVAQDKAYEKLAKDGFAGNLMRTDKQRERIEKEQDLKTQEFAIRASEASIAQAEKKIAQISADYRRQLQTERVEVAAQLEKAGQDLAKSAHRQRQLELRAPASGAVKDLATHTIGTVAAPGTILMTLVPREEQLFAEVWVGNQDVGFVRDGQEAKIKFAAFPFQKYGMGQGRVRQVSADASDAPGARAENQNHRDRSAPQAYKAMVGLQSQALEADGARFALAPGMQVSAEIHIGTRSIIEYVFSPVRKAFHEAGRER
ncbi:MAG: secretion protein HylD [Betaproteobacteria bacterium RIFCSPLOWO2_02_FULL_62_17]|nr:MAG: secretion protein HylD [Betaproteobacteria bacterium RIFCSPLOWO2_02_FULL_62_17]